MKMFGMLVKNTCNDRLIMIKVVPYRRLTIKKTVNESEIKRNKLYNGLSGKECKWPGHGTSKYLLPPKYQYY